MCPHPLPTLTRFSVAAAGGMDGSTGLGQPGWVTLGESLSLSGPFFLKSLVPVFLPNSDRSGRWGVVKGQGAGDKDQGTGMAC